MKKHLFYIADVFTDTAFGGNQLAVFPNGSDIRESDYQKIAREINFSETTFVLPSSDVKADFRLRIFTPFSELPMAGHPTIGSAFVLQQTGLVTKKKLLIEEGVGNIPVELDSNGAIWMNQPLPVFKESFNDSAMIAELLSLDISDISLETSPQKVSCGIDVFLIQLNSLDTVKKAKLNLNLYENLLNRSDIKSIMIFSTECIHADSTAHSRFFAPAFGILEDPATGSATCPLASFMVKNNLLPASDAVFKFEQGFEIGRPSILFASVGLNGRDISFVKIGGQSVLIGEGNFYIY